MHRGGVGTLIFYLYVLQLENKKTIKNLSVYIYKLFKKRNEFLY